MCCPQISPGSPSWCVSTGSFPLGIADASVVALSERLGLTEVATLDHRHFHAIRPRHCHALTLLP